VYFVWLRASIHAVTPSNALECFVAQTFLDASNSNNSKSALHAACENGDLEFIKLLLSAKADANLVDRVMVKSPKSPIVYAIRCHHNDAVAALIEGTEGNKADIEHRNS
jgi:ankyrin repeat protein